MSNISYNAVVLDDRSREKLIKYFKSIIPENWDIICHHMTINMGEIDPEFKTEYNRVNGLPIYLAVNDYAINDKVIAVGVTGFPSKNSKPHITIAVNRSNGGKPVMSNYLTNWKPLKRSIMVVGRAKEVKY